MSHTPGKWVVKYDFNVVAESPMGEFGRLIASTGSYSEYGPDVTFARMQQIAQENRANAKLMSAAPELLAACEYLLESLKGCYRGAGVVMSAHYAETVAEMMDDAVRKAKEPF